MSKNQRFYIETFGCQMNKSDSELMAKMMESSGYTKASTQDEADIVVFNTCSVRKNAEERAVARLNEAHAHAKEDGLVIAAGCLSQHIGEELLEDGVCDIVVGPYQSPSLPAIIESYRKDRSNNIFVSIDRKDFKERLHESFIEPDESDFWHKWVTITHGCENFCTYCIVPFVRGPLVSFPSESILNYIRLLPAKGVIEITLLGQNVNQYGQDSNDIPFFKLLAKCAEIPGIKKINFMTSHPKDFSDELIDVIAEHETISNAIHLPMQSGSDSVLKRMNRAYDMKHYMAVVDKIRRKLPSYALSTDMIVGFPEESEAEFQETLTAVEAIRFDEAYMYAYSPREGTLSARNENQVAAEVRKERLAKLIELQRSITVENLERYIGTDDTVIIERVSKKSETELAGRTSHNRQIVVPGSKSDIGTLKKVRIEKVNGATLYGLTY